MSLVGLTVATSSVGVAQQPASRIENAPATDFVVNTGLASSAVVVQLTTDNYASGDGWTAAYACDTGFHNTSSLNNTASSVASNLVIVQTIGVAPQAQRQGLGARLLASLKVALSQDDAMALTHHERIAASAELPMMLYQAGVAKRSTALRS